MAKSAELAQKRNPATGTSGRASRTPASTEDGLRILTYVESVPDESGSSDEDQFLSSDQKLSLLQRLRGIVPKIDTVSPETLQANLTRFLRAMEKSLSDAPVQLAEYRLEEIEVAVEVSAEGEVSLLGNGAKVGGKGTLTLKLKHFPAGK
jgi:hypothetical protein